MTVVRISSAVIATAALLLLALTSAAQADHPPPNQGVQDTPLVVVGREPVAATWIGGDSAAGLRFRTAAGDELLVTSDLVRWGYPAASRASAEVHLADGSRLALAESWLGDPPLTLQDDAVRASCDALGELRFDRQQLAAVFWKLPRDASGRSRVEHALSRAAEAAAPRDCVLLLSGDIVTGQVLAIGEPPGDSSPPDQPTVTMRTDFGMLALPIARLAGVLFGAAALAESSANEATARLQVMLRDGSRLDAAEFKTQREDLLVRTLGGVNAQVTTPQDVVGLQGFGSGVAYLSDMPPDSFDQHPEFSAPWPLARDAAVAGGPLLVRGHGYAKGLGMHAPARAEYSVPPGAKRFAATVAIDDSAAGGGSAIFRVLVRRRDSNEWIESAATETLRGNDPPQRLAADVEDVDRVALFVTTADRGDELDRAVWLDARLER